MAQVYLGLGSNQGNREQLLNQAIDLLRMRIGAVERQSAFYETEPWGFVSPNAFLNAVVEVHTSLSPAKVLERTRTIEYELGRRQKSRPGTGYADRTMDVDLLLFDDLVLEADYDLSDSPGEPVHLSLPHPRMHERLFVMEPLAEIAPALPHPVIGRTMQALCRELKESICPPLQ